jgi:hypothetical protein
MIGARMRQRHETWNSKLQPASMGEFQSIFDAVEESAIWNQ